MQRTITVTRVDGGYQLSMNPPVESLQTPYATYSEDGWYITYLDWEAVIKRKGDTIALRVSRDVSLINAIVWGWKSEPVITGLVWLNEDGSEEHILGTAERLVVQILKEREGKATTSELGNDPRMIEQLGRYAELVDVIYPLARRGVIAYEHISGRSDNPYGKVVLI